METDKKNCSCGNPKATIEENRRAWADDKCAPCYEIGKFYEMRQLKCLREEIAYLRGVVDAAREVAGSHGVYRHEEGAQLAYYGVPVGDIEQLKDRFANLDKWEGKQVC